MVVDRAWGFNNFTHVRGDTHHHKWWLVWGGISIILPKLGVGLSSDFNSHSISCCRYGNKDGHCQEFATGDKRGSPSGVQELSPGGGPKPETHAEYSTKRCQQTSVVHMLLCCTFSTQHSSTELGHWVTWSDILVRVSHIVQHTTLCCHCIRITVSVSMTCCLSVCHSRYVS